MQAQISLARIPDRWRSARTWLLMSVVAGVLLSASLLVPTADGARLPGIKLPPCPFKALTGVVCPFCGMTAGTAWLIRGEWYAAWRSNLLSYPFVGLILAAGVYTLSFRLLAGRRVRFAFGPRLQQSLWTAGIALVILSWLFRVWSL